MKHRKPITTFTIGLLLGAMAGLGAAPDGAWAMGVTFERDPSLPLVHINVAVKAGFATDPDGQSGITNFMGEMLLRGTELRSKEQIDLALDRMGAELSVETRAEALIFRGTTLASQLEPFLGLLGEILARPKFPENEVRKLKSEIVSGILDELGNDRTLGARKFYEALFRGHPYGKPTLGRVKDVEKFTSKQARTQWELLLKDSRMIVVGNGDADPSKIQAWASALGARLGAGQPLPAIARPTEPQARRVVIIDKPDRTQTQVFIGQIGATMVDPAYFALHVANHAFGGGSFSARMMVEIRVKRGWSYGAYSSFRFGTQPRSWNAWLMPAAKDTPPALELVLRMLDDLRARGVTAEEFELAKTSLVAGAGFTYNTPAKRVENALLEKTLGLPDGYMRSFGPRFETVTIEQANQALSDFLHPDRVVIVLVGTASELRPAVAKATGVTEDLVEVIPYDRD